jgi:hypothetical protein
MAAPPKPVPGGSPSTAVGPREGRQVGPPPDAPKKRQPFPVPWGLLIALGIYFLCVTAFTWWRYWSSPEYQAATHYAEAVEILGVDDGRKCAPDQLIEAYEHLLEAGRLMPDVKELHERAERLNWRFEERHIKQPIELRHRAEANANVWLANEQKRAPMLVVGVRDRGWAPDQLIDGPATVFKWSFLGVLVIVIIWAYGNWNAKRIRAREHEADLVQVEREVKELGGQRERRPPPGPPRRR